MPEFIPRPQLPTGLAEAFLKLREQQRNPLADAVGAVSNVAVNALNHKRDIEQAKLQLDHQKAVIDYLQSHISQRNKEAKLGDIMSQLGRRGMLTGDAGGAPAMPMGPAGAAGPSGETAPPPMSAPTPGNVPISSYYGAMGLPAPAGASQVFQRAAPAKPTPPNVFPLNKPMIDTLKPLGDFSAYEGAPVSLSALAVAHDMANGQGKYKSAANKPDAIRLKAGSMAMQEHLKMMDTAMTDADRAAIPDLSDRVDDFDDMLRNKSSEEDEGSSSLSDMFTKALMGSGAPKQ